MKILKQFIYQLSAASLLAASPFSIAIAAGNNCLDNSNLVCITETYDATQSSLKNNDVSRYTITNNGDKQIFAFAVTNAGGNGLQAYLEDGFTGWSTKSISVSTWDNAQSLINFSHPSVTQSWVTGTNDINNRTELGSFTALFGSTSDDNQNPLYANFYWNSGTDNPLTSNTTLDAFYFYGLPESNFVALDQNGAVVSSSLTAANNVNINIAAVPEPKQYFMLIAGICMLSLLSRRKKVVSSRNIER